jgi:hypothetical protein
MVVIAPGPPDFQLHTLGWRSFQDLAGVVLREICGQSFQTFADSNDGGRDGAFYGIWRKPSQLDDVPEGPSVLQCKHSAHSEATLTPSSLSAELTKVARLVRRGMCKSYILLSNARITGDSERKIRESLLELGVEYPLVLGGQWLNQTIARTANLRMFVPRVYGLGDLSQILDERVHSQAQALLSYLGDDLARMVVTDAYKKAARAIRDHGFVLLLGEPAVGKSLIAATLAMTALDKWSCLTLKADSPAEFVDHWNPHEPNRFIWMDDAFGSLRHDRTLTDAWVRRIPLLMTAIKSGTKVVLTSRDYIYRHARPYLKEYAHPILKERQVIVEVEELTPTERRQILYNHIRLGNQDMATKQTLKPFLEAVADVTPFRPEVARRLGRKEFTSGMSFSLHETLHFMKYPTNLLRDIYAGLDAAHQAALMLVQSEERLLSPLRLTTAQHTTLERYGVTEVDALMALRSLEGTFLRAATVTDNHQRTGWSFRHPTLREGFAAYVDEDINRIMLFIATLSDRDLLLHIDCGSDDDQGTLVVVPPVLHHQVAERLATCRPLLASGADASTWYEFFNSRTSVDFVRTYLSIDSHLIDSLVQSINMMADEPSQRLLLKLQKQGLLSEEHRQSAIAMFTNIAVERPEASWLDQPSWRDLFVENEYWQTRESIRLLLISNLNRIINDWRISRPGDENPCSYFLPLEEALTRYQQEYSNHADSVEKIEDALRLISEIARAEYHDWQVDSSAPEYDEFEEREIIVYRTDSTPAKPVKTIQNVMLRPGPRPHQSTVMRDAGRT